MPDRLNFTIATRRSHMSRVNSLVIAIFLLSIAACGTARAQDFRVYTTIQDLTAAPPGNGGAAQAPVVARTLTLFHAGKAYDYIPEIGEVIVIEFDSEKRH